MIATDSFFSGTLNTVDSVISNFVKNAYENINANAGMITGLFTFYVVLLGYRILTHREKGDLSIILHRLVVLLCVYGMVMQWNLYNIFIYNIFTNEPANIAKILVDATGNSHTNIAISQTLDRIYESVIYTTMTFFGQTGFSISGLSFILYGLLTLGIGSALCIVALLLFIYAKMMMAISLALGPIFILFILWETTKDIFAAWLRKLVTIALIPIVTSAILALMLSVIEVTLPNINVTPDELKFIGIAPFLGLSLTTAVILSQTFKICSALGGGITLASISKGVEIAKSSLTLTGLVSVSRKIGQLSSNQTGSGIKKRGIVKPRHFNEKT